MKKITVTFDLKSLTIGFFAGLSLLLIVGSTSTENRTNGRYQARTSDGTILILDTQTGQYILETNVNHIGKMSWIKGDFASTYKSGKNKTK